jgi:DNA-binding SARP family transcriptional activator/class 3 adenylate cyclase
MEFRILGPLEVVDDEGRTVSLGGARQRALLAALILRANQVVPSDQLLHDVWGEEAPASGVRLVQVYVSQLRKALGNSVIVTRPTGYVLVAARDAVDREHFERLVGQAKNADSEAAAAALREALALWRGPPLADFTYDAFAQVDIARLHELKLSALEAKIEADLELGRHAETVGELEALVAENPLREQLRAHLMVALYRSGRQQEALAVYQEVGRALRDELGLEPGRSLRELHQAILNQDASLDPPRLHEPLVHEPTGAPEDISSAGSAAPHREVRKTITAVVVSLGISSMRDARLDPEALRRVTARAFAAVEAAVDRHGGSVDSVGGEALTAVFGLPTVHEDDALRAARAAVEARGELIALSRALTAERALELVFRIGISTGEVVTGGGTESRLRATGEPLSSSSRLAQAAQAGDILCDESAWRLVRDAVIAESAEDAWRLVEVPDAVFTPARRLDSPMVGRNRERRRLHDAFEQAVGDRSCQLFTVLGLAGVGKSRLVQEFLYDLAGQARVARGRCLPYGQGITYWPLLEAVKEAVGLEDADSLEVARTKLFGSIGGDPGEERLAQRVAEMIGLTDIEIGAEEGFAAVRELFERLAQTQPLVVVFDDIHWGESRFLDLVEHVADWTRDAPIMLVCLARPELLVLRPEWGGGKLNATVTLLEPLSGDECSQLIQNIVGEARLAEEVGARIVEAADGNPLFVEEMLLMLIDEGLLVHGNGRWSATGDVGAVRVPPTIQALLAARLDQLDDDERAVIERAAVVGKVFQAGAISELAAATLRPLPTRSALSFARS